MTALTHSSVVSGDRLTARVKTWCGAVSVERHCGTSAGYRDSESSSKAQLYAHLMDDQPKGGCLQPHLRGKDPRLWDSKALHLSSIRQSITASVLK